MNPRCWHLGIAVLAVVAGRIPEPESPAQGPELRLAVDSPGEVTPGGLVCHAGDRLRFEIVMQGPGSVDAALGPIEAGAGLMVRRGPEHHAMSAEGLVVVFPLTVIAWQAGTTVLPGIPVRTAGGAWQRTDPVRLLVSPASGGGDLRMTLALDPPEPFEGQAITAVLEISAPPSIASRVVPGSALVRLPWQHADAGIDLLPAVGSPPGPRWSARTMPADEKVAFDLVSAEERVLWRLEVGLVVRRAGAFGIGEGVVALEVQGTDTDEAAEVRASDPVAPARTATRPRSLLAVAPARRLVVRPLPRDGAPQGGVDAVGFFECRGTLRPGAVRAGEAVVFIYDIEGDRGAPALASPSWPDYDACGLDVLGREEVVGSDWHRWMTTLVPRHEGIREIPAPSFRIFDPRTEGYRDASIGPLPLSVSPRAMVSSEPVADPSGTQTRAERAARVAPATGQRPRLVVRAARWILRGGWLLVVAVWLVAAGVRVQARRRQARRAAPDSARELEHAAVARLAGARRLWRAGREREAARELAAALGAVLETVRSAADGGCGADPTRASVGALEAIQARLQARAFGRPADEPEPEFDAGLIRRCRVLIRDAVGREDG